MYVTYSTQSTCHSQLAIKWYHCAKESDRGNKVPTHVSKHFPDLPEQAMHIRVIPTQDGQCYIVTFLQLCQNWIPYCHLHWIKISFLSIFKECLNWKEYYGLAILKCCNHNKLMDWFKNHKHARVQNAHGYGGSPRPVLENDSKHG